MNFKNIYLYSIEYHLVINYINLIPDAFGLLMNCSKDSLAVLIHVLKIKDLPLYLLSSFILSNEQGLIHYVDFIMFIYRE